MLNRLKKKINCFLWTNDTIKRICNVFLVKECAAGKPAERRKKIDPRYTNSLYPEFVDRREKMTPPQGYDSDTTIFCREHPLYKIIVALGIIAALMLFGLAFIYMSPSGENLRQVTPKTVILR